MTFQRILAYPGGLPWRPFDREARLLGLAILVAFVAKAVTWAQSCAVPAVIEHQKDALRVCVITGGHAFDISFGALFEGYRDLVAQELPHDVAFRRDLRKGCDVVVAYEMVQELAPGEEAHLRAFLEAGRGLVVLHHALAAHNQWEWWWKEVVGARYILRGNGPRPSDFQHDVQFRLKPVAEHPVLSGIGEFELLDETYRGMWFSPQIRVLMETDHPAADRPVVWVSPYEKARVIVIQPGHGRSSHYNETFRKLVRQAVLWAAGKL